ncbi:MAG: PQQ-like beta-propeller repeat protein [Planctomycetaceae bacterium]|nr:PQQ-like beta-propeller repeat protein [Planctomycetaceae bacterium]
MSVRTLLCLMLCSRVAHAGDWPQILGPQRNGIASNELLLPQWPANGPETVWESSVGQGFAGVAVLGDALYLFHRQGREEVIECRKASTGETVWATRLQSGYAGGYSDDSGPRCVPLLTKHRVITFGAGGRLTCLNREDGAQIWQRDTWADFQAPEGYFGAGSTPLLVDDTVVVNVGGRGEAAVVAFDLANGATRWSGIRDTASYSSPVLATVNGTRHLIVVSRMNCLLLDPRTGERRAAFDFGMRGPTVNGATPVMVGDSVFVSSSYRVGSVWAKIVDDSFEPVESGEDLLATQYATPVEKDGLLYAVDGRQDIGPASLKCIDPAGQKVVWEESGFDYGTMIRVKDELLFLTCGGELIRLDASPDGLSVSARHRVLAATPRGYRLPALSRGLLFVRDDSVLKCLRVGN